MKLLKLLIVCNVLFLLSGCDFLGISGVDTVGYLYREGEVYQGVIVLRERNRTFLLDKRQIGDDMRKPNQAILRVKNLNKFPMRVSVSENKKGIGATFINKGWIDLEPGDEVEAFRGADRAISSAATHLLELLQRGPNREPILKEDIKLRLTIEGISEVVEAPRLEIRAPWGGFP